ncbi:hypothetical protein [Polycladidibacter hongkongensis]|uniref:hypothetical protein n=1 Tax=Polycladidibacter hongkongensis TaxID=1647556 RepID=UPI001FCB41BA|nr:hypothetical protein [Pseudovibrio hongkongensis]
MQSSRLAVVSAICAMVCACQSSGHGSIAQWYEQMSAQQPKGERLYICHGFGCAYTQPVMFEAKAERRLRSILAKGRASASNERKAIAKAVSWQEKRVAASVGSAGDVGGLDMQNGGQRGQLDCIDEAANTTSLLLYAQRKGMLRYHTVERPDARGFFLDGRYPHATAVIKENESGALFAVDSWRLGNGQAPDILPLKRWRAITAADLG